MSIFLLRPAFASVGAQGLSAKPGCTCKGTFLSWPRLMTEHLVEGMAGPGSADASNSPVLFT